MPSSSDRLREKFMSPTNDGIDTCTKIIESREGSIDKDFYINIPPSVANGDQEFWDAVEFLRDEWDYALR